MSILDFTPKSENNTSTSNQKKPPAQLWLNVGYEANGKFINLPVGIPVDTMDALPTKGQNEEWVQFQSARNDLLEQIKAAGNGLEAGAEIEVRLTVKLRKVAEEMKVDKESNPFATDLSSIFG